MPGEYYPRTPEQLDQTQEDNLRAVMGEWYEWAEVVSEPHVEPSLTIDGILRIWAGVLG